MAARLAVTGIEGIPLIAPGDDLAAALTAALEGSGMIPGAGDILVVAQKIVSKAENRYIALSGIEPSPEACRLAEETDKDPRQVEAILRESSRVVRAKPGVIVVEHRLGLVLANAGIDRSNVEESDEGEGDAVLLLPEDPDASAARLKRALDARWNADLGVIVADSVGRPWRLGTVGIAIGIAGVMALDDRRGRPDLYGRLLEVTVAGHADAIAAAATLVMGEGAEGTPAALVSGAARGQAAAARDIVRPAEEDMFR